MTTLKSRCYDGTVIQTKETTLGFEIRYNGGKVDTIMGKGSLAGVHRSAVRYYLRETCQARL